MGVLEASQYIHIDDIKKKNNLTQFFTDLDAGSGDHGALLVDGHATELILVGVDGDGGGGDALLCAVQVHQLRHVILCVTNRAGHFRYILIFSIIKNDFLHFLSSYFDCELAF